MSAKKSSAVRQASCGRYHKVPSILGRQPSDTRHMLNPDSTENGFPRSMPYIPRPYYALPRHAIPSSILAQDSFLASPLVRVRRDHAKKAYAAVCFGYSWSSGCRHGHCQSLQRSQQTCRLTQKCRFRTRRGHAFLRWHPHHASSYPQSVLTDRYRCPLEESRT